MNFEGTSRAIKDFPQYYMHILGTEREPDVRTLVAKLVDYWLKTLMIGITVESRMTQRTQII